MKKTFYILSIAVAALAAVSCNDSLKDEAKLVSWTFNAYPTKAQISDEGAFSWNAGDRVAIWNAAGSGAFVEFADKTGKGVFTATAPADAQFTSAIYPASVALSTSEISLPSSYTVEEVAQFKGFPMSATVDKEKNSLYFRHLGALLSFEIYSLGGSIATLSVVSADGSISGTFPVSGTPEAIELQEGTDGISVDLSALSSTTLKVTVPMPTGTYNYSIVISNPEGEALFTASTAAPQTFFRAGTYSHKPMKFSDRSVVLTNPEIEALEAQKEDPSIWK